MTTSAPTGPSAEERERLASVSITLNGEPAFITGRQQRFPRIVQRATRLGCEFSWPAIANVIDNKGGAFRS
jgi:hypothetical protein